MYTTYHFNSANELNIDILEAIKTAFKEKPISITIVEEMVHDTPLWQIEEVNRRTQEYLLDTSTAIDFDQAIIDIQNELKA